MVLWMLYDLKAGSSCINEITKSVGLISALFTTLGCTAAPTSVSGEPLAQYQSYNQALARLSERDLLTGYWSRAAVTEGLAVLGDHSPANKQNRNAVIYSIRFPEQIRSATAMNQAINGNSACLRIEGKNDSGENVVFRIPYVMEQDGWRIKEAFIEFPPPGSAESGETNCDEK